MQYNDPRPSSDPELFDLIRKEDERQRNTLKLIPSENYASDAVLEASGSSLTNKYSEGYPGKRYYEGQVYVDQIERLAQSRAMQLFDFSHANVQPYSGSSANLAVYKAFLSPGDTVMGMSLPMGGHLTHGWGVSATGTWFRPVQYGVRRDTGRVDLDEVRDLALAERPKVIFCGGTAVPRTIEFAEFSQIAREIDAVLVADIAHISGLVAGGAHPSPAGHADVVSSTTHKTLRGPRGGLLMGANEDIGKKLDRAVFPGLQGGPHNNTTAALAVALGEAQETGFADYAHQIVTNAKALASQLASRGFDLVSGGTDNHLLLLDLTNRRITAKRAAAALDRAGIECNYNTVPFDTRKPFDPSGIRIGTPAVTSRGMGVSEMVEIAKMFSSAVQAAENDDELAIERIALQVRDFTSQYPAPGLGS